MRTWLLPIFAVAVSVSSCVEMRDIYRARVNAQFPLEVGSVWTYAYYDSLSECTDTLTVSVISAYQISDGSFQYVWQFTSASGTTMCPVVLSGTTVRFPQKTPFGPKGVTFDFPLEDAYRPAGKVVVPAGSFPITFLNEYPSHIPHEYNHFQCWISPGVGIVMVRTRIFETFSGHHALEVFELISYRTAI
jgi:hypothetical protein